MNTEKIDPSTVLEHMRKIPVFVDGIPQEAYSLFEEFVGAAVEACNEHLDKVATLQTIVEAKIVVLEAMQKCNYIPRLLEIKQQSHLEPMVSFRGTILLTELRAIAMNVDNYLLALLMTERDGLRRMNVPEDMLDKTIAGGVTIRDLYCTAPGALFLN